MLDMARRTNLRLASLVVAHLLFSGGNGFDATIQEGSKAAIACTLKKERNLTWQIRGETEVITVTSCNVDNNSCVDYMPDRYYGEVEKTSDGFKINLVISSARINETEFRCTTKYGFNSFMLQVYARPSRLSCKPAEVDYTKRNLVFTCSASNVYPSIRALLYTRGFQISEDDVLNGHCSKEEADSLNPGAYVSQCVWRILAAKLEPLTYKYYVKIYPNLINAAEINVPYVDSPDYTLQLSIPKAVINYTLCPVGAGVRDGKITSGSTASCRCVLESKGFPPAQARWYTLNGNESLGLDDNEDGSSTLIIRSHNTGQSYQCRVWSPLRNALNWGPVYTPTFAAPSSDPEPISLRIEVVAGIFAGIAALAAVIAVVVWRWRSHKRQTADSAYSRSCLDNRAVIYKPGSSGDKTNLSLLN